MRQAELQDSADASERRGENLKFGRWERWRVEQGGLNVVVYGDVSGDLYGDKWWLFWLMVIHGD